jgi:hypothetical protein
MAAGSLGKCKKPAPKVGRASDVTDEWKVLGAAADGREGSILGSVRAVLIGSLIAMVLSGIALLTEEAGKCFYSPAFRWKMAFLAAAVLFYFTLHHWALRRADTQGPTVWSRSAALISLTLWLGVGIAGRAIGLL